VDHTLQPPLTMQQKLEKIFKQIDTNATLTNPS